MLIAFNTMIVAQVNCDSITSVVDVTKVQYTPPTENPGQFYPPHPTSSNSLGDKAIYWVHGMNGNSNSWAKAADWVQSHYKVISAKPDYGADQTSWDDAWTGLRDKVNSNWSNVTKPQVSLYGKSFGIGHSLGGLMLRKISEQSDPEPINGIVTYSSPHGGSDLAKYIEPANDPNITTHEFEELENSLAFNGAEILSAPISEYLIFGNITYNDDVYSIEDIDLSALGISIDERTIATVDRFFSSWPVTALFAQKDLGETTIADLVHDVMNDEKNVMASELIKLTTSNAADVLEPGSGSLDISEQITPDGTDEFKRVAFFGDITTGNENAHYSAFKMLYSSMMVPSDQPLFTAENLNGEAVAVFDDIKTFYEDQEEWYQEHYDKKYGTTPLWYPWSLDPLVYWGNIKHLRDEYGYGFDGFTKLNDYYEYIAGAREYGETESELGMCFYEDEWGNITIEFDILESECGGYEWVSDGWTLVNTLHPFDGLLTAESMVDWNTAPNIPKIKCEGSNHVTIPNDKNTESSLIDLLDGNKGKFFKTEKR